MSKQTAATVIACVLVIVVLRACLLPMYDRWGDSITHALAFVAVYLAVFALVRVSLLVIADEPWH